MDRDLNAALNILARGREIGREPPESRPAEEKTTTLPLEAVQVYPVKQEASLLVGGSSRGIISDIISPYSGGLRSVREN